jgi:hypothetical protein
VSADTEHPATNYLADAHDALARGAWEVARGWFEEALEYAETPEALEGLATAAWWQNDVEATFPARERAYRLYRERGDRRGAGRVAAFHAVDYCSLRSEPAVANGWIQRARRQLDGLDPGPEHAMVAVWEGHIALTTHGDSAHARKLSTEGAGVARTIGAVDWEMVALSLEGLALVVEGDVVEGMRRLDEAATAAIAGEMTDLDAIGTVCCYLIFACERVRDYDRASQWCDLVKAVSTRWSCRVVFSLCWTHYAGVLIWQGVWSDAEATLTAATSELTSAHSALAVEGLARLAELRRRQGRLVEAAALFRQIESQPARRLASKHLLLGKAALALDLGDPLPAPTLPSATCAASGMETRSSARPAWSCWSGPRPPLAPTIEPAIRCASSEPSWPTCPPSPCVRRFGSSRASWPRPRMTTSRRAARSRTRSTSSTSPERRSRRRWPGSTSPARSAVWAGRRRPSKRPGQRPSRSAGSAPNERPTERSVSCGT